MSTTEPDDLPLVSMSSNPLDRYAVASLLADALSRNHASETEDLVQALLVSIKQDAPELRYSPPVALPTALQEVEAVTKRSGALNDGLDSLTVQCLREAVEEIDTEMHANAKRNVDLFTLRERIGKVVSIPRLPSVPQPEMDADPDGPVFWDREAVVRPEGVISDEEWAAKSPEGRPMDTL